jgi:hypothetical protein
MGALAVSFNRMQAGSAERQRLQAAFGTYVDPTLAARLLEQGDDVFTGERREVTVMFVVVPSATTAGPGVWMHLSRRCHTVTTSSELAELAGDG